MKEAVAAEAEEADKVNDAVVNKDDSKPATLKPRQSVHHSKKKKKKEQEEPSKRTEPLMTTSMTTLVQARVRITRRPLTLHLSEEAKLKNDLDGSSC